jgi:hypothetical protein
MMKRIGTAALVVALVLTAAGSAGDKTAGGKQDRIPGGALWDYGAWADDYLVVGTSYDAATRQVTWTLEARRKVPARSYKASFFDPDLLEMAAPEIHFDPAQPEYRKGARIRARIELPGKDVMQEVNRVRVDRVGDDPAS